MFCSGAALPRPADLDAGTCRFAGDGYDGQFYRLAVSRGKWAALAPPLLVSLSVSLAFASPFVAVVKGLLGRASESL